MCVPGFEDGFGFPGLLAVFGVGRVEVGHDAAGQRERVLLVVRVVVRHARRLAVQVRSAQLKWNDIIIIIIIIIIIKNIWLEGGCLFGGDDFAGGGLDEGRAAEEDGAVPLHDHALVGHRRHVRSAGRARTQHDRHLK
jgi:hypothetical protein